MEVKEYLLNEVALNGIDEELQSLFNYGLAQVFSPSMVGKIEEKINKMISIKEVVKNDENIVAYQSGNVIYVNKPVFSEKTTEQKIQYLLHEFFHILQTSKHFLLVQNFKEINEISKQLFEIIKNGLISSYSMFLTGKDVKLPTSGPEELLPYFANGKITWSAVTPQTRIAFVNKLKESGIFNLRSKFWTKRLFSR